MMIIMWNSFRQYTRLTMLLDEREGACSGKNTTDEFWKEKK